MKIESPSLVAVKKYSIKWETLDNYVAQESSLKKLFSRVYPTNIDLDDVLIKVCSLNDFYSTNIYSPFKVAQHIVDLNIDERLSKLDTSLVNEIAKVYLGNGKTRNFYSFATKYCSHHSPESYPIFDNYVKQVLSYFKKTDGFSNFTQDALQDYSEFCRVLSDFRSFYDLGSITVKQLDKYLWQVGKESFKKRY